MGTIEMRRMRPFYSWLGSFRKQDGSTIGSLAVDIYNDVTFPQNVAYKRSRIIWRDATPGNPLYFLLSIIAS
ncbi:MAG TPA: hypothetical protein VH500_25835 [Nitrososphaeraceae archaeon]